MLIFESRFVKAEGSWLRSFSIFNFKKNFNFGILNFRCLMKCPNQFCVYNSCVNFSFCLGFWVSKCNCLNEMPKSYSVFSPLFVLIIHYNCTIENLRFIECCNQILVYCSKLYVYLNEFPCSKSHISSFLLSKALFGCWENFGQTKVIVFLIFFT